MSNFDKSAPWYTYVRYLELMLQGPGIDISFDETSNTIEIRVESLDKAYAIEQSLPKGIRFGTVNVHINVIPANIKNDPTSLMKIIFKDSPIVDNIIEIRPEGSSNPFVYVMFKHEVVQYWDDNLGDPHGNEYTLYQNIAEEVFEDCHDGVLFTTSPKTED